MVAGLTQWPGSTWSGSVLTLILSVARPVLTICLFLLDLCTELGMFVGSFGIRVFNFIDRSTFSRPTKNTFGKCWQIFFGIKVIESPGKFINIL